MIRYITDDLKRFSDKSDGEQMKTKFRVSSSLTRMHDRYQSLLIEENEKEENKIVKSL